MAYERTTGKSRRLARRASRRKVKPSPKQQAEVSKRDRAKGRRGLKRQYGLTRRDMGAIGAAHMAAPWEAGS